MSQSTVAPLVDASGNMAEAIVEASTRFNINLIRAHSSYALFGREVIKACQAIDLHKRKQPDFMLAPATAQLYRALRTRVAFLQRVRPLTADFRAADALLRGFCDRATVCSAILS